MVPVDIELVIVVPDDAKPDAPTPVREPQGPQAHRGDCAAPDTCTGNVAEVCRLRVCEVDHCVIAGTLWPEPAEGWGVRVAGACGSYTRPVAADGVYRVVEVVSKLLCVQC